MLNFLFQAAAGDQLVDEHWFVLANAIGAVAGLGFDRRIPPGVEVDHGVGGGQVEAGAAGFQADQKHRHLAALELFYRGAPVLGAAGEFDVADLPRLQFGFDQRQHRGELREQQHPAAGGGQFIEHFQQAAELARVAAVEVAGRLVQQAQVAAALAQA